MKLRPGEEPEEASGYLWIGDGLCPEGQGRCDFWVNLDEIKAYETDLPWKYYNSALIGDVIESPQVIFEGLRRDGYESAFCYSFIPKKIWLDDQETLEAPPKTVFLAYVCRKEEKLIVFDWAFRSEDEERPGYPKGWRLNFERVLWQKP